MSKLITEITSGWKYNHNKTHHTNLVCNIELFSSHHWTSSKLLILSNAQMAVKFAQVAHILFGNHGRHLGSPNSLIVHLIVRGF